jgi:putative Holliday junction resolvase
MRAGVLPDESSEPVPPLPPLGRILALDVGGRRIGVAMSDAEGVLAMPHTTLKAEPRARALEQIVALVAEFSVDVVVVGLPLTMSGEIGPQAQVVQAFARELEAALDCPVQTFDERLTSVVAEQMMRDLGIKPNKRKERIDEIAACIILQDYIDHQRSQQARPPHPARPDAEPDASPDAEPDTRA